MTEREIIKALECCISGKDYYTACLNCPIESTCENDDNALKYALDLINSQKAKIEALQMDNKQLQSDVINANQNWDHIKGLWECEKEKVESAKQKVICACKMLKTAKSEAIKEFAERLKEEKYKSCEWSHGEHPYVVEECDIDNLVKEMTEENEK